MIEFFKRISFLDSEDNLSITNISMIVTLIVGCFFQSYPSALMFLVAFANYADKRTKIKDAKIEESKAMDTNMVMLQNQLDSVNSELVNVKKDHEQFIKSADETRKLLSEKNLAKGFTGRIRQ